MAALIPKALLQGFVDASVGGRWEHGLVVGQRDDKDSILALVKTPPRRRRQQEHQQPGQPQQGAAFVNALDVDWIANHALSVARMLPGGVDVLGVYLFCPSESALAKSSFGTYKKLFKAFQDVLPQQEQLRALVLIVCSQTRKSLLRSFDLHDRELVPSVVDLKQATQAPSYLALHAVIPINMLLSIHDGKTLEHAIERAKAAEERRQEASLLLGPDGATTLSPLETATIEDIYKVPRSQRDLLVDVVLPPMAVQAARHQIRTSVSASATLSGAMHVMALVSAKTPARVALRSLRRDALRSLDARIHLLLDDLEQSSSRPASVLRLPKRHFIDASPFFCDYLFADESVETGLQRMSTLLSVDPSRSPLLSKERFPAAANPVRVQREPVQPMQQPGAQSSSIYVLIAAAIVILFVAIFVMQ